MHPTQEEQPAAEPFNNISPYLQLHFGHRQLLLLQGPPQVPQLPPQHVGLNQAGKLCNLQQWHYSYSNWSLHTQTQGVA